jgi:hypothetical protein
LFLARIVCEAELSIHSTFASVALSEWLPDCGILCRRGNRGFMLDLLSAAIA